MRNHPIEAAAVPLSLGVQGLAMLWDRRAAEAADGAVAEAYHRAAAEAQEVIRALGAVPLEPIARTHSEQHELGI